MNLNAKDTRGLNRKKLGKRKRSLASMEKRLREEYGYRMENDVPKDVEYSKYAPLLKPNYGPLDIHDSMEMPITIHQGSVYIYERFKISESLRKFGLNDFTRFVDIRLYDGSCFK
jgi:hypothetical protein